MKYPLKAILGYLAQYFYLSNFINTPLGMQQAPWYLPNGHFQTIIPSLLRQPARVKYTRQRINTPDGDFLDLDWAFTRNKKFSSQPLIIISHGLEGDSQRPYVKGMAKAFLVEGYDVLAWNYRGCSGEPNHKVRFYHSGATEDLATVLEHAYKNNYEQIILLGFSLGGNLTLKYAGEQQENISPKIKAAIAISTPVDLSGSSSELAKPHNRIYELRFLRNLRKKLHAKLAKIPDAYDIDKFKEIKSLKDFDDVYTSKLHGYTDAEDYYSQCNSLQVLAQINIPTLLLNAKNDPFLSEKCFPNKEFANHPYVNVEITEVGGHVGFSMGNGKYYSEERAVEFVAEKADLCP